MAADLAAAAAAKAAEAARADAEEKAAIAAKAVAAAKSALDMVASVSEEASSSRHQRKNKLKKHVPVQMLYKKNQPVGTCGTDEELARSLHRAMNSSPRILNPSPVSGSKNRKHKKPRTSPTAEKNDIPNDTSSRDGNGKMPSTCNGDVIEGMDYEGSREDACNGKVDEDVLKSSKADELEMDSVEAESSHSKGKNFELSDDMCNNGRKRGRIKQKKLPLSFCNSKDQANPKDDLNLTNSFLTRARTDISTACHVSLPSADKVTPMEIAPTWKCLDFKVPQCIKQDKFVQS